MLRTIAFHQTNRLGFIELELVVWDFGGILVCVLGCVKVGASFVTVRL